MSDMLRGELVYLAPDDPQVRAANFYRWFQDTEFNRYLDTDPSRLPSEKKWKEWLDKDLEKNPVNELFLSIHPISSEPLSAERNERSERSEPMIGFIGLFDLYQQHGDTLVAIALGEREYWGKGYGTDAMRIMLRFAFNEVNLRRVGLIVFEYNPRAIRSYEKAGFVHEGRVRGSILREDKRYDFLYMGVLREEWLANGIMTR